MRNSLDKVPHDSQFFQEENKQIQLLYIYLDKEIKDYSSIEQAANFLTKKYIKSLVANSTKR